MATCTRRNGTHQHGFTLIEVLIVCAVIAIIASIMVPNYAYSRATANEGVVIGTLRSIATAEFQFKSMGFVDENFNSTSEFGTIAEMSGTADLRGLVSERLAPTMLSLSVGQLDANARINRHGYLFALYLPDATGTGQPETPAGITAIDPGMAENYWTVLAWPLRHGGSGRQTYFVNQSGEIVGTRDGSYSGATNVPAPGAALVGGDPNRIDRSEIAVNATGSDGSHWTPVN